MTQTQTNSTAAGEVDLGYPEIEYRVTKPAVSPSAESPAPTLGVKSMFFASVWKLLWQRYYWAPERFVRMVRTMAQNIPTQLKILRILSRPAYLRLIAVNPRFPLKCLTLDYLVRGLTIKQQAGCFMHHYRRLPDVLPENLLAEVLLRDVKLGEICEGDRRFAIWMGLSRPWDDEGEMSLNLEVNGKTVFVLSFTIIPGWVVQSEAEEVILVSRVQGVKGCYEQIQLVTKAMHDIAPPALLFAALCGVAEAYGIRAMAGISATMKPEFHFYEGEVNHIQEAYDGFFVELGAAKGPANFYLGPLPPSEKPMTLIKRGHKTRTRRKRAFKRQIAQGVFHFLREASEGS